MLKELGRKVWIQINPFPNDLDILARRRGLSSIKDLDFEIRVGVAVSEWRKHEAQIGLNYFESGHDTYVGIWLDAMEFGPDVAAYAIEKGFAILPKQYSRKEVKSMIKSLKYQAAEEGWNNPNLKPFKPGTVYEKVEVYKLP